MNWERSRSQCAPPLQLLTSHCPPAQYPTTAFKWSLKKKKKKISCSSSRFSIAPSSLTLFCSLFLQETHPGCDSWAIKGSALDYSLGYWLLYLAIPTQWINNISVSSVSLETAEIAVGTWPGTDPLLINLSKSYPPGTLAWALTQLTWNITVNL